MCTRTYKHNGTPVPIDLRECLLSLSAESIVFQPASQNIKTEIHKTIILSLVLYGCETWSLILREERRLRVFENRVLRKIFGHKTDEVTGEWRRLHYEKLCDVYTSTNISWGDQIKQNEMGMPFSIYEGDESCIQGFREET